MKRNHKIFMMPLLFLTLTVILVSCSGGGGGGASSASGLPFIGAELDSFPTGSVPPGLLQPGFNSMASVNVIDDNSGDSIPNAVVTINGILLIYNATNQDYEGNLMVAFGGNVNLNVTVDGNTYKASSNQFPSYPTISVPSSGATWPACIANAVTWLGGNSTLNTSYYGLAVLDAANPNGPFVWPIDNIIQTVSSGTTSYSIPGNSLTAGNRLAIVGIASEVAVPNAAQSSYLIISGFNYVPITVSNATLVSIAVTPTNPSIAKGMTQKFTATGTLSDNSTRDLTAQVTWASLDTTKATINSTGLVSGTDVGSSTITATLGSITGSTMLTVTPAVVVSIEVSPMNPVTPNGTTQQFTAMGMFSDSTTQEVTTAVVWSSSNTGVATISNVAASNGLVTTKASGSSTITATSGSVFGTTMLTVTSSTWKPCVSGTQYDLHGVTSSGSLLVAVGGIGYMKSGQVVIITSPDSVTWTSRSSGALTYLNDIIWSGSQFVTVGPTDILTSPDGVNWTERPNGYIYVNATAWSGTKFVSIGSEYELSSTDGINWVPDISLVNYKLNDIVWSDMQFVAVGASGAIVTSSDGVSWILRNSGSTNTLNGIAWSGSIFSAVGASGTILTSSDGITWTKRDSGTYNNLNAIIWSGNEFITVGIYGTILTSPDGITWSSQGWGSGTYGPSLQDVTWTGSKYVVVGDGGIIITSQ